MYTGCRYMDTFTSKLTKFLASRTFFYVIVGFFVFETLWFVFSAVYPMAFDEEFHLGIIQIYANQWSPFLSEQPVGAEKYGALVHDPSYFYHYAMSFPYRIIELFTQSETIQVIILRLMNVAMFVWGLTLYRKVMLRAKASPALAHTALALFVLIPIVPQLAAHINYDNTFMFLVPLLVLGMFSLIEGLAKRQLNMRAFLIVASLCLLMSIIKYAALPFVLAAVLFFAFYVWLKFKGHGRELWPAAKKGFAALSKTSKYVLTGGFLLLLGLFSQRYVVNVVQYKTPVPDCGQVLTVEECSKYGPWGRDHFYAQTKDPAFEANPVSFMGTWLRGMWHRLFFAVSGPKTFYDNYRELPVPSQTAVVLAVVGTLTIIIWWAPIFRGSPFLAFCMTFILVYVATLWLNGYSDYDRLGRAVAINGRYLLPILPLLAIIMGKGISLALKEAKRANLRPYLATLAIVLFLHGGGVFTFIIRSDDSWLWPNQAVVNIKHAADTVLSAITYKGLEK